MSTIVVPFAGAKGKTRLHVPARVRRTLSLAMLVDVLSACVAIGRTRVATSDAEGVETALQAGAEVVDDPGGGQSAAVAAALAGVEGPVLVINSDLPCLAPHDLCALLAATPPSGIALVEAPDGTTNGLSLSGTSAFSGLYGPDSASRFREHAAALGVDAVNVALPNLADDVDTLDDLHRLQLRCGPRTQACLAELEGTRD
jgi:2-phospho-L-lactate guanylyltransferase